MHYIDLAKDIIQVLLDELKRGLKKHKIFAIVFPVAGVLIATLTFVYYDTFKEKVADELFGIAGCFIGTVFVFQMQEITKDRKKIKVLTRIDKNIDVVKAEPTTDEATNEKIYELFKETLT